MITPVKVSTANTIAITVSSGINVFIFFSPLLVVVSGANRKFGFTHYLYALCCHGNTDTLQIRYDGIDVKFFFEIIFPQTFTDVGPLLPASGDPSS